MQIILALSVIKFCNLLSSVIMKLGNVMFNLMSVDRISMMTNVFIENHYTLRRHVIIKWYINKNNNKLRGFSPQVGINFAGNRRSLGRSLY
jgi:hypothetical protein